MEISHPGWCRGNEGVECCGDCARSRTLIRVVRALVGILAIALCCVAATGCGSSNGVDRNVSGSLPPAVSPPDYPGAANEVPPTPAKGTSRTGLCYNIYVEGGHGEKVAFSVCEPGFLEGGKTYPLVLHSHGFGGSRDTGPNNVPGYAGTGTGMLVANGYGFISIDERGHGESGGTIRAMDPDYEGKDLIAVMDWAETHLDWLAYGSNADGSNSHSPIIGSIGGSYGGMYQYLIHDIDPRHRVIAMVPEYAPYDLNGSMFPNEVPKTLWDAFLFVSGTIAGNGLDRLHFDPFINHELPAALLSNSESPALSDFFRYHSDRYFCEGLPIASNGGPGTSPEHAPLPGPRVHAMLWQGMRDTLFDFTNAWRNYECLKAAGGDVRLLSYQAGHNSLQAVPDPDELLYHPLGDDLNTRCGTLEVRTATLAFFDEYLKGQAGAADRIIPRRICLSISGTDAVLVDTLTSGHAGTEASVQNAMVTAGIPNVPTVVDTGITAGADGLVIGGIPRLEVSVQPLVSGARGVPIIFAGIGIWHSPPAPLFELVDNQISPLRDVGEHDIDMSGVAARLKPGEKLVLLLYGGHDQYLANGSINLDLPSEAILPVTVSGKVWIPVLSTPIAAP